MNYLKRVNTALFGSVLLVFLSIASFDTQLDAAYLRKVDDKRVTWDMLRFETVATEKVIEILAIKPGMTILDIGTGTGPFAYEFARRLNGTGSVFATDIDIDCIDHVRARAIEKGLANLHPVLVNKAGLDPFYRQHRYDLITVFHTFIPGADYYRQLRDFFAENGRLILILHKQVRLFSPEDIPDFSGLVRELSSGPPDSPFSKSLNRNTLELLRKNAGREPNDDLKRSIVDDLNATLVDNFFVNHFANGYLFKEDLAFSPAEREYANLLLRFIVDEGILHKNKGVLGRKDKQVVMPLNKLLLNQKFRKYFRQDRLFSPAVSRERLHFFGEAGYSMKKEYTDVLPFSDILVFAADKQSGEK